MVYQRAGFVVARVLGAGADQLFRHEPGGHRWQRIPPTERKGRVHTSTVTVTVLPEVTGVPPLKDADLEWEQTKGSGPGGQHRQKNETACILTHKPTGLTVRVQNERSLHRNQAVARAILTARVHAQMAVAAAGERNAVRRAHVGSGMRGDKVRTIRCQDAIVTDHRLGRRMPLDRYLSGQLFD